MLMLLLLASVGVGAAGPTPAGVAYLSIRPTAVAFGRHHFDAILASPHLQLSVESPWQHAEPSDETAQVGVTIAAAVAELDAATPTGAALPAATGTGTGTSVRVPLHAHPLHLDSSFFAVTHSSTVAPDEGNDRSRDPKHHSHSQRPPLQLTVAPLLPPPSASPALPAPRALAVSSGGTGSGGRPPRLVSPTASRASQYFPSSDPFNKGGLLRLRGVGYQVSTHAHICCLLLSCSCTHVVASAAPAAPAGQPVHSNAAPLTFSTFVLCVRWADAIISPLPLVPRHSRPTRRICTATPSTTFISATSTSFRK